MSENTWRRSSFSSSDWEVDDRTPYKRDRDSCEATQYGATAALKSSTYFSARNVKRSRSCSHPSKQLPGHTLRLDRGFGGNRRIGESSSQREALVWKSTSRRKCYYLKDRTENASAVLRRTLRNQSPYDTTKILRTVQIIAAARRPMTVDELAFAVNTRLPTPYRYSDDTESANEVKDDRPSSSNESLALCQGLLKCDSNGVVVNGVAEFCHKDMRDLVSFVAFRQHFELAHEDEILAAICIQHLGCRGKWDDVRESTRARRCPATEEAQEDCPLRDYAVSFWKEHYFRMRGGSQIVHSLLHQTIVSALSKAGPSEMRCGRDCNDVLATGLEMAATHDLSVLGRAYVEMGAELRQCNHSTHTPLHTAVANSSGEMIRLLLGCGADPNAFTSDGLEPQTKSCSGADAEVSLALALLDIRHNRCHCWRCCNCFSGRTALHLAAATGQEASLRILVAGGADINLPTNRDGDTALHLATRTGKFGIVQFLLASGADVTRQNSLGATALQIAKMEHHYPLAKLLLAMAPSVAMEPAIDAIYVQAAHDSDQSATPLWRMQSLSLEDTPLRLSTPSSKLRRDTRSIATAGLTDPKMCPDNESPPVRETSWVVVEVPDTGL